VEAQFEVDNLAPLIVGQIKRRFRVPTRGVVRLTQEVLLDGGIRERFAAVPHHGGDESQVGRRQRAAIRRDLAKRSAAVVRIVHRHDIELRVVRSSTRMRPFESNRL
jgi:hypothetical protein